VAATIAPDWRSDRSIAWALLHALGKRLEHLGDLTPDWAHAESWLRAHQTRELIVLRAQHLTHAQRGQLAHLASRADIALVLVYSGHATAPPATLTLDQLLSRPRRSVPPAAAKAWPEVPRSHPWRVRTDCARLLPPEEFRHIDDLLLATFQKLERWLQTHRDPTRRRFCSAIRVLRNAHDPNQQYIRECAITVALESCGHKPPRRTCTIRQAAELTDEDIDEALSYTSANHGAFLLASRLTGLTGDLLDLVMGDQLTDDTILGLPVPTRARPVLRKIPRLNMTVLSPPHTHDGEHLGRGQARDRRQPPRREPARHGRIQTDDRLASLFDGRRRQVRVDELSEAAQHQYRKLHEQGVLELRHGTYRAGHAALYGTYQLPSPPIRALTNDWDESLTTIGNPADI
jgi:hypothetical protein